jgi:hypothetical protein
VGIHIFFPADYPFFYILKKDKPGFDKLQAANRRGNEGFAFVLHNLWMAPLCQ